MLECSLVANHGEMPMHHERQSATKPFYMQGGLLADWPGAPFSCASSKALGSGAGRLAFTWEASVL